MLGRSVTDVSKIKENDFGYESYTALKKKPIPIEKKKKKKKIRQEPIRKKNQNLHVF